MIDVVVYRVCSEPFLSAVSHLLVEGEFDDIVVLVVDVLELDLMLVDLGEVLLGLLGGGRAQPLVVLDLPGLEVPAVGPLLELVHREERVDLLALGGLEQRRHELLQEAVHAHQARPEVVDEVYQQTLDVRAVIVLISHYHDRAVAQVLHVLVLPPDLDPQDLDQVLDLRVLHDLLVRRLSHVQELTSQRENTIVVSPYDLNASQG